ncbi:actin-like protein [Cryptosporidium felis]|nr:actin-like protein [Cryptosporidium felis]
MKVLIIDNGSFSLKVGYLGDSLPRYCFPNCIGKVRKKDKVYISDQTYSLNEYFSYCPFSDGLLVDMPMEYDIWEYIFKKINISPEEYGLIVTEPFMNPTPIQHSLFEMIFEQFGFKKAVVTNSSTISQFAFTPKTIPNICQEKINPCYLILDCGYQCCFSIPVYKGTPILEACRRLDIGGYHLDLALKNALSLRQVDLSRNSFIVSNIKENCCYVSNNFNDELDSSSRILIEQPFQLPELKSGRNTCFLREQTLSENNYSEKIDDSSKVNFVSDSKAKHSLGGVIKLHSERITIPELLFNPSYGGYKLAGIAEMVSESILASPLHLRELLANNILLIGGSTNFKNFESRLNKELITMLPTNWVVQTRKSDNKPEYSPWIGSSIWGESNFESYAVSKNQYRES